MVGPTRRGWAGIRLFHQPQQVRPRRQAEQARSSRDHLRRCGCVYRLWRVPPPWISHRNRSVRARVCGFQGGHLVAGLALCKLTAGGFRPITASSSILCTGEQCTFVDVRVFNPYASSNRTSSLSPPATGTTRKRNGVDMIGPRLSPRSGTVHFSPQCPLFHRRMGQGCCCNGEPDRIPPVAAWEGGVFYANCPTSLTGWLSERPAAFERRYVSAWGSTSLAAQ